MTTDLLLRQNTIVTAPPAGYAVTAAQARTQLSMEAADTSKDTELSRFIAAAHRHVENTLGYPIISQTRATHLYGFPESNGSIWLGGGYGLTVDSVEYYDTAGAQQTLATTEYLADTASVPARIVPAPTKTWPSTQTRPGAVIVTWTAGWDDDTEVLADAPEIVQAILLLVGHFDVNREAVLVGAGSEEIKFAVEALLLPHRMWV